MGVDSAGRLKKLAWTSATAATSGSTSSSIFLKRSSTSSVPPASACSGSGLPPNQLAARECGVCSVRTHGRQSSLGAVPGGRCAPPAAARRSSRNPAWCMLCGCAQAPAILVSWANWIVLQATTGTCRVQASSIVPPQTQ
jgi:hypothetical protein